VYDTHPKTILSSNIYSNNSEIYYWTNSPGAQEGPAVLVRKIPSLLKGLILNHDTGGLTALLKKN
jgi:hypothetical protein